MTDWAPPPPDNFAVTVDRDFADAGAATLRTAGLGLASVKAGFVDGFFDVIFFADFAVGRGIYRASTSFQFIHAVATYP